MDLFDPGTGPLNVFFKVITPMLFCVALVVYGYIRHFYSDKILSFIDMLLLSLLFMTLAMVFRFYGDGMIFGYIIEYIFHWFERIALVVGAVFFVFAAYKFSNLFGGDE